MPTAGGCAASQQRARVPRVEYCIGLGLAALSLAACVFVHLRHVQRLRANRQPSAKRGLYVVICRLAPALAVVHMAAVALPPLITTMDMMSHVCISIAMYSFLGPSAHDACSATRSATRSAPAARVLQS